MVVGRYQVNEFSSLGNDCDQRENKTGRLFFSTSVRDSRDRVRRGLVGGLGTVVVSLKVLECSVPDEVLTLPVELSFGEGILT